MASQARLLCIMGSGETAPTMVSVHAELMDRAGSPPGVAVMLDTPYGFQENASEISAKTTGYFNVNVGHPIEVASLRDSSSPDALALERLHNMLRDARYIFAGPGSPSYALRQWRGSRGPRPLPAHPSAAGGGDSPTPAAPPPGRRASPPDGAL